MIVDTSALIAVLLGEEGSREILDALDEEAGMLPAPALAEYWAVASGSEHEIAERDRRRIERHLAEARLLPGKTVDSFDFAVVPLIPTIYLCPSNLLEPSWE